MDGRVDQVSSQNVETLLIDLDDTLYTETGVASEMRTRITDFAINVLGMSAEEAEKEVRGFSANYGTALAGFVAEGFQVDLEKFYHETHEMIDLPNILVVDPDMRKMLSRITLPKYIFTNGSARHAERVLQILGLTDLFKGVISFDSLQELGKSKGLCDESHVICKPHPMAFDLALEQAGGAVAGSSLFLDDNVRNIIAAQKHGIPSILVGKADAPEGVNIAIKTLHDLPTILPDLFVSK